MDLRAIQHDLIANTTEDDWYLINIAGPAFHYRWQFGSGPKGEFSYIMGEHSQHAVCRSESSLTMSWGLDVEDRDDERGTRFPWAQDFPDKTVHQFWVDFFWNNALIDRVQLGRIDGGHGTIPMPGWGNEVTDFEVAVAILVNSIEDKDDIDSPLRYIKELGFKRVTDGPREGAGSKV